MEQVVSAAHCLYNAFKENTYKSISTSKYKDTQYIIRIYNISNHTLLYITLFSLTNIATESTVRTCRSHPIFAGILNAYCINDYVKEIFERLLLSKLKTCELAAVVGNLSLNVQTKIRPCFQCYDTTRHISSFK